MLIPDCKCGSPAHLVDNPREYHGTIIHFYGVECEKKHHTPKGFTTEKSALIFWTERFAKGVII